MFGIYRTLLAVVVIADHTGLASGAGAPAVYAFFCLSGFLMTMLITGPYKDRLGAFFLNRFLRLYPMYWAAFALGGLLWWAFPEFRAYCQFHIEYPVQMIRQALFIVYEADARVIAAAWAVTNEIACYFPIGLGATQSRRFAALSFAGALGITLYLNLTTPGQLADLYFPVTGALLPFALGGLLAQYRHSVQFSSAAMAGALAFGALGLVASMALAAHGVSVVSATVIMGATYLSLIPAAIAVLALYHAKAPFLLTVDRWIGKFSYPSYLTHFLSIGLVATQFPGLPQFAATVVLTGLISLLFIIAIDDPVERLRDGVRKPKPLSPASTFPVRVSTRSL